MNIYIYIYISKIKSNKKNAIANKRRAYQKYLQNPYEENFETYKMKRNIAKSIVSKTHKESWDRFI
jgi:uncharacterized ion transporter superfamily protein YfcC